MRSELIEQSRRITLEEEYFRRTGIHRYTLADGTIITGLSANTWEEYLGLLRKITPQDKYIVSPELITYAGEDFMSLRQDIDLVNQRIGTVLECSSSMKETVFVLSTPLYLEKDRVRNSVLLIKNGEIINVTNKRSAATQYESDCFEMVADEPSLLLPGTKTALLICADFPTASLYANCDERSLNECLRLSGRQNLVGKKVNLIPSTATSLLVISCWSVGGRWVVPGNEDYYYGMQLRNIAWNLMRNTMIREVAIVDRSPNSEIQPFNSLLRC